MTRTIVAGLALALGLFAAWCQLARGLALAISGLSLVVGVFIVLVSVPSQESTIGYWRSFAVYYFILHFFLAGLSELGVIQNHAHRKINRKPAFSARFFFLGPYLLWMLSGAFGMTAFLHSVFRGLSSDPSVLSLKLAEYYSSTSGFTFYVIYLSLLIIPACIFRGWIIERPIHYLEEFAETLIELRTIKVESNNWTDEEWRRREIEKNRTEYEGSMEMLCRQWSEHWQTNCRRNFNWEAFLATAFLGEKDFEETRQMFLKDNREPITRWSVVTGKEIPAC